jgi:hypothetical protein
MWREPQADWAQKIAPRARENSVWWGMSYEYFRLFSPL